MRLLKRDLLVSKRCFQLVPRHYVEGYLPELACVMTNPAAYPGGYPPRSVKAAQIASLTDGTVVPFDPMTFVASAFKHVPGAILSLGVASHATCTNEVGGLYSR